MNPSTATSTLRTPYHQLPITYVMKAVKQKMFRQLHCIECGWPVADITDKVVMIYDGDIPVDRLEPSLIGIAEIRCHRHQCKQYYRLEFAM